MVVVGLSPRSEDKTQGVAKRRLNERLIGPPPLGTYVATRRGFVLLARARCRLNFVAYATKFSPARCAQFHENTIILRVFYSVTRKSEQKLVAYATKICTAPRSENGDLSCEARSRCGARVFRLQNVQTPGVAERRARLSRYFHGLKPTATFRCRSAAAFRCKMEAAGKCGC